MDAKYLNTTQLAEHTGIAASTWNKRRLTGDGPVFCRVGRRVLYRWSDVEAWFSEHTRKSTSDA